MTYYKFIDIIKSNNWTYALNNSKSDGGIFNVSITGDWSFKFKGKNLKTIYGSDNGQIGTVNSKTADIFNLFGNADGAVWTYAKEEGDLCGYNFIKIRWDGYSYYGDSGNTASRLTCDIIFFDNGDISFYTHKKNTYRNTSVIFSASSGNISFDPIEGRTVTFEHQDDEGNTFILKNREPSFLDTYDKKYLFQDNSKNIYTIKDEALFQLEETELSAELFKTYGLDTLPDGNILKGLNHPTVLYWHDSNNDYPEMRISFTGLPKPQVIYSENIDMSDSSILGIDYVRCDCDNACLIAASFDDGVTWWSYLDGEWEQETQERTGITKDSIEIIGKDAWAKKVIGGTPSSMLKYRFVLSGDNGYINNITTYFRNTKE